MSNLDISMVLRLVDRMSAPMRAAARPLQAMGDDVNRLQAQMAAVGQQRAAAEQVQELGTKAGIADDQMANLRRETERLSDEERELARRLATTTDELVRRGTLPSNGATRAVALGGAIGAAGAGMHAQGAGMIAGAQSGAMGVAIAGFGAARFMTAAIGFDTAMRRVGAVSRATEGELAALTAEARRLGAETPWAASQAAEGMQFLAMAGFDVNQTIDAMPGMLNLASAAAIDLGTTSDITSNILSGFGLEAAEMGRLGDVMTNTFTSSNTTLTSLGSTMSHVAPVAVAAAMPLELVAAMAGKLGDAGIQGERGGTALRAIISRLAAPSGEAAAALEALNIQTADADGNLRDLPTILAEMEGAMQDMGTAARTDIMATVFGLEAQAAASILLGQSASGELQNYNQTLTETGSAARVAAEMTAGIQGDLNRLKSVIEATAISIGTVLLPPLSELVKSLMPIIDSLRQWAERNPELVMTLAKLAAGLLAAKAAVVVLGFTFGWILGPVGRLLQGVGWVIRMMGSTGLGRVIFALVRGPFRVLFGALRMLTLFMLANPIVAAITAIATIGYLIYKNWDQIVAYFEDKIETIRAAFDEGLLQGVLAVIAEFNPFQMMADALDALIEQVTGISIQDLLGEVNWNAVFGDPIGHLQNIVAGIRGVFDFLDDAPASGGSRARAGLPPVGPQAVLAGRPAGTTAAAPASSEASTFNIYQQPGEDAEALARRVDEINRTSGGSRGRRGSRSLHDGGAYAD